MSITAGEIAETISTIRSKIRVYETLKRLLEANYLPSDGGLAELRIDRSDGAYVTEKHFGSVLEEFEERLEALAEELKEWEGLVFSTSTEDTGEDSEEAEEESPAPEKKKPAATPSKTKKKEPLAKVTKLSSARTNG